jgi:Sec-independent protein translocase protein TatA
MKNLTVALSDERYHRARAKAAEAGRSLSAIVAEFLDQFAEKESEFERLKRMEHELRAELDSKGIGLKASENLSRDEIYEERFRK